MPVLGDLISSASLPSYIEELHENEVVVPGSPARSLPR